MAVSSHIWKEVLQCVWRITRRMLAAAVGFEPTELSFNGFQDRHLKPLGHTAIFDTQPGTAYEYLSLIPYTCFTSGVPIFTFTKCRMAILLWRFVPVLADRVGFEPTDAGVKFLSLTTWRTVNIIFGRSLSRWPWLYINITNSKCQYQIFIFLKFLLFQNCFI